MMTVMLHYAQDLTANNPLLPLPIGHIVSRLRGCMCGGGGSGGKTDRINCFGNPTRATCSNKQRERGTVKV